MLRKRNGEKAQKLEQRVKEMLEYESVVKLQACVRRFLVQQRMQRLQIAASTIQRYFRTFWLSKYYKKMIRSAIIIQRFMRKHLTKKMIIRKQFQKVISNTGKTLQQVIALEYQTLFGQKSFSDGTKQDLFYQNYLEKKKFFQKQCANMIPRLDTVNLKKRAKVFSLLLDFNSKTDTANIYSKSWANEYLTLLEHLKNFEERILQISVQDSFSFLVTDKLKVYSWGSNNNNQLARSTDFYQCQKPLEVKNLSKNRARILSLGNERG